MTGLYEFVYKFRIESLHLNTRVRLEHRNPRLIHTSRPRDVFSQSGLQVWFGVFRRVCNHRFFIYMNVTLYEGTLFQISISIQVLPEFSYIDQCQFELKPLGHLVASNPILSTPDLINQGKYKKTWTWTLYQE